MKATKLMAPLLLGMAVTMLTNSCSEDSGGIEPIRIELSKVTQTDFAACGNDFANNLLATLANQPDEKGLNVVVSPISVQYLISMMANTATDEAREEVFTALGISNYTLAQVNQHNKELLDRLQQDDQYVKVALANSIWASAEYSMSPELKQAIATSYNADIAYHDFINKSPEAKALIDQWAYDKTHGLINRMGITPTPLTAIILANATYFNGKWSQPFNGKDTRPGTFYNEDNTTSQVSMMSKTMSAKVYADDNLSVAELSYGRGYYSMMIVMPKNIQQQLTERTDWWGLHNKLVTADNVEIVMPKFKVESGWTSLVETCKALGIRKLFDQAVNGAKYVAMGQDAMIEVEENGTKAAAVSAAKGEFTSPGAPSRICFDHPFVYAIRENTTGTILFIGKTGKL